MVNLICAALFFVGIHVGIAGTSLRGRLVGVMGEDGFRGFFSLLSIGGILWLVQAYRWAPFLPLWDALWMRHLAPLLMIFAFLFVVLGLTTPSPTTVGGEARLTAENPASGILRITRHPFLCGIGLWAAVHLVANGDAAAVTFFGTFLLLAVLGPRSIDAKRAARCGASWQRFADVTSVLPFGAILGGRNQLRLRELGWWRPLAALLVYGLMLTAHRWLFGVSPLPS